MRRIKNKYKKQNKPSFTLGLFCFEDSFIGIVDGKPMKFVNEEEYLEYIFLFSFAYKFYFVRPMVIFYWFFFPLYTIISSRAKSAYITTSAIKI